MEGYDIDEILKQLPSDQRCVFLLFCSQISTESKLNKLIKRVELLEGNLATMRSRFSNLEKNIKK